MLIKITEAVRARALRRPLVPAVYHDIDIKRLRARRDEPNAPSGRRNTSFGASIHERANARAAARATSSATPSTCP